MSTGRTGPPHRRPRTGGPQRDPEGCISVPGSSREDRADGSPRRQRPGRVVVVSGTGTGIGKTIATAAIASVGVSDGLGVAVVKIAQTGVGPTDEGDAAEVERLVGPRRVTAVELCRFAEPLAPATAARRSGAGAPSVAESAEAIRRLADGHDVVLAEGAGGLLVRLNGAGETVADLAAALGAEVLVVTEAGLGTLSATALTLEALDARKLRCAGLLLGSWPAAPDLASRCNVVDLRTLGPADLVGAVPAGSGGLDRSSFAAAARASVGPEFGGDWNRDRFVVQWEA